MWRGRTHTHTHSDRRQRWWQWRQLWSIRRLFKSQLTNELCVCECAVLMCDDLLEPQTATRKQKSKLFFLSWIRFVRSFARNCDDVFVAVVDVSVQVHFVSFIEFALISYIKIVWLSSDFWIFCVRPMCFPFRNGKPTANMTATVTWEHERKKFFLFFSSLSLCFGFPSFISFSILYFVKCVRAIKCYTYCSMFRLAANVIISF